MVLVLVVVEGADGVTGNHCNKLNYSDFPVSHQAMPLSPPRYELIIARAVPLIP